MAKKAFNKIMAGLEDALADVRGEPGRVTRVTTISPIEPAVVRAKLEMTQDEIGGVFGIPPSTWRKWEQHKRELDSASRLLLHVIDRHPELVQEVAREAFQQVDAPVPVDAAAIDAVDRRRKERDGKRA